MPLEHYVTTDHGWPPNAISLTSHVTTSIAIPIVPFPYV